MDLFPKGLVHGFGPKLTISQPFYFRQKRPGKCVSRYYGTQKPTFKAIKLRRPKSRKMDVFPKVLVHGFGPKLPISSRFYFSRYRPGKCVLWYSRIKIKNNSLGYKIKKVKSRRIDIFLKGLVHGFGGNFATFATYFFRQYRPGKYVSRYYRTKNATF